jgi:DNA-binding NtrC family response regulator
MSTPYILVVDDEPDIRELVRDILTDEGFEVNTAASGAEARASRQRRRPGLILLDIWMPDIDGITLLREWTAEEAEPPPVIMISGHATVESAVEATRLGAWDFLEKPLSLAKLLLTVRRALEAASLRHENQRLRRYGEPLEEPAGRGATGESLREEARRAAAVEAPVLLTGEPGTGKRTLARYIHGQGHRAAGPFVEVSAATLGEAAIAETIFGRETEGGPRYGLLERAGGGTLFLAHVEELGAEAQAQLLAALESGRFRRVDGQGEQPLNVRIIAATQWTDGRLAGEGRLRRDLFDRLAGLPLHLPPLRERLDDLPDIVAFFADHMASVEGLPFREFDVAALNRLRQHPWPGNLRELRNLVQRLAIAGGEGPVTAAEVEAALGGEGEGSSATGIDFDQPLRAAREAFERAYLKYHLEQCGGRVGEVARVAGLERTHLYRKLRALGLQNPRRG